MALDETTEGLRIEIVAEAARIVPEAAADNQPRRSVRLIGE